MYVGLVLKAFANKSLIVGIESGNTKTKDLTCMSIVKRLQTHYILSEIK